TLRLTAECSTIELLRSKDGVSSLKQTPRGGVKSPLAQTAVHREILARHELRCLQEKYDRVGDLVGRAAALRRSRFDHLLPPLVDIVERNHARRDRVHRDRRRERF